MNNHHVKLLEMMFFACADGMFDHWTGRESATAAIIMEKQYRETGGKRHRWVLTEINTSKSRGQDGIDGRQLSLWPSHRQHRESGGEANGSVDLCPATKLDGSRGGA
jgi:hypothetical protein